MLVGPGAVQQDEIQPVASLEGASEYEYVTILNPLSDDFAVRVAQDVPVNMPMEIRAKTGMVQSSNDVIRSYGLDLKNSDFTSRKHIVNDTVIKSGQTINLKGNEAQVAVRQLVNEMLQRDGKSRLMADPHLRKEAEDKIIVYRGSIQDLMTQNIQSTRSQIDQAIDKSNEVQDEEAFPELTDLANLKMMINQTKKEWDDLKNQIADQKAELEREIAVLEQKKRDIMSDIISNHTQNDEIRENFADWQKKLEEISKNLSIREQKLEQKEESISRNYNLLNL